MSLVKDKESQASEAQTTKAQATADNSVQTKIAAAVSVCSIAYLIYLLTAKVSPQLGGWAGPHTCPARCYSHWHYQQFYLAIF